jgi:hypothetical protein
MPVAIGWASALLPSREEVAEAALLRVVRDSGVPVSSIARRSTGSSAVPIFGHTGGRSDAALTRAGRLADGWIGYVTPAMAPYEERNRQIERIARDVFPLLKVLR